MPEQNMMHEGLINKRTRGTWTCVSEQGELRSGGCGSAMPGYGSGGFTERGRGDAFQRHRAQNPIGAAAARKQGAAPSPHQQPETARSPERRWPQPAAGPGGGRKPAHGDNRRCWKPAVAGRGRQLAAEERTAEGTATEHIAWQRQ